MVVAGETTGASEAYGRIERISKVVDEAMRKHNIPGATVVVFRDYRIEWERAYGLANRTTSQPVEPLSSFQAASISKPVAALAVMRLVQEGRLDLDRDVNTYLKGWKLPPNELTKATPVTLRLIMSHTAGLSVHGFKGYEHGAPLPSVADVLDGRHPANSEAVRVVDPPNTKTEYSGGGYTILQQILCDVTGMSFPEAMKKLVLNPAGMQLSTYEQPIPASMLPLATAGHIGGKVIAGERHVYPEMAAAGLWTTPSELALLAISVQNARDGKPGSILSKELARQMIVATGTNRFGLGFEALRPSDKVKKWFGHTGGNAGYRCMLLASLEGGYGVAVMTNGDEFQAVSAIVGGIVNEYGW